ncbi:MAG TPA: peptidyl-dipeptidase Dcp [Vicinamibacterales bacterium]|nr:peptidyl-dipeptidase Dcp [Vicinamibacterales bacterium]
MVQRAVVAFSVTLAVGFGSVSGQAQPTRNPLLNASPLPFQAPPFDRIKDTDFGPAFEEGMKQQRSEIQRIADDPDPPTFDNTLVALERSGQTLSRVEMVFNALGAANTDDALQKLQEDIAPKLSAHQDEIALNAKLFRRIETLYTKRDRLHLAPEAKRLLEYQYQQFVMAGARLADADKARLKKLNEEDAALSAKFMNQLLAAAKDGALVVDNQADLARLSDAELGAAAEAARARHLDGKWLLSLSNTTQQPLLASLSNRTTRERLFRASWTRAERGDANDTRMTIARQAEIRAEKAKVLGLASFAEWRLQDQMAKTPANVEKFLADLVPAATAKAKAEAADIQPLIDRQHGGFTLQPWDWDFYAEQVRRAKFSLDVSEVKPYFELNRVLEDGVFFAAQSLYGISFKERHDLPIYQPDVRVFEVFDKDGSHLGLIYFDYFKRDNKNGGAWMDTLLGQSKLLGTRPVIYNVANFVKPAPGQPALVSFDDVTTMFHEFGHGLHGLFADQQYPTLSGTAVARDYVEFPSQFNEHWALDPTVFSHYARHYQTGEPMPQALVDKIKRAAKFNQGYALTELLAAADLDMAWHTATDSSPVREVDRFEADALARAHLDVPQVPPRYRSSYFLHVWANGYAAGYYAYLWTEMLDDDAFVWFEEHGGLTRENGQRFRDLILSRGNTEDYAKMFKDFRGRDPIVGPMLVHRGLREQ